MLNELNAAGESWSKICLHFSQCRQLIPAAMVDCIDHAGYCEDGRTFMVTCTTVEWRNALRLGCLGESISISPCTAPPREARP